MRVRGIACAVLFLTDLRDAAASSSYSHITNPDTMDILIFKGQQVTKRCINLHRHSLYLYNSFGLLPQHLEEVRMQYKVKAQLQYFFTPPDHSDKAAALGNEEAGSAFLQKFYAGTA